MNLQIPFSKPEIDDEEINEVTNCLKAGWLTTGPKVKEFEKAFKQYLGSEDLECIAVNSATAGLHLALEGERIGAGDEILTTPYTFTATAEVVRYLGAEVTFVDIEEETFNINPALAKQAITPKTKGILPVHMAGLPADMETLLSLAGNSGICVIEDAAHAFGSKIGNTLVGCLSSHATVFSFYATKCITTGEGGMIVTRDHDRARRYQQMRLHGIDRDAFDRYRNVGASWYYEVMAPGFKYNLTDIAAAIGVVQLKKAEKMQERRRQIAERYLHELAGLPLILPTLPRQEDTHAWHLFITRITPDSPVDRDTFILEMAAKGIQCSVHYIPLHLHPYWRDRYSLKPEDFPISLKVYQSAVSLPLYSALTETEQSRVIETIHELLGK